MLSACHLFPFTQKYEVLTGDVIRMLAEARFDGQHTGRRPTAMGIRASLPPVNSQIAGPLVRLLREGHWGCDHSV